MSQRLLFPGFSSSSSLEKTIEEFCAVRDLDSECVRVDHIAVPTKLDLAPLEVPVLCLLPPKARHNGQHSALNDRDSSPAFVALWFKGNMEDLSSALPKYYNFALTVGVAVIAPEFPGYGGIAGSSNEAIVDEIAQASLTYASQKWPTTSIILAGQSMGAGPAIRLCSLARGTLQPQPQPKVVGLLTVSAWATPRYVFLNSFGGILPNCWDSLTSAPDIVVPWCVVHGTKDVLINCSSATALMSAAPNAVVVWANGIGHNGGGLASVCATAARHLVAELSTVYNAGTPQLAESILQTEGQSSSTIFCHGFNNTSEQIENSLEDLSKTLGGPIILAGWRSAAAQFQSKLSFLGSISACSGASSYSIDNTRTHFIGLPSGKLCIVAHSHGCRVVILWLLHNRNRWGDITRIALAHPDIASDLLHKKQLISANTSKTTQGAAKAVEFRVNEEQSTLDDLHSLLVGKVAVFDTKNDFATTGSTVLGAIFRMSSSQSPSDASRDIGHLCARHLRANGASHNLWLKSAPHRELMLTWLVHGGLGALPDGTAVCK